MGASKPLAKGHRTLEIKALILVLLLQDGDLGEVTWVSPPIKLGQQAFCVSGIPP